MTSRERVLATFEHVEPDRVPAWCGSSAEFWSKAKAELHLEDEALRVRFGDDFRRVFAGYCGPRFPHREGSSCRTVFGVERHGMGYGQPIDHPLANATIRDIDNYAWPDPAWTDVSHILADATAYGGKYAILGGDWSPFWHDAIDLMGMENLYMRMYDEPQSIHSLMKHMVDYYAAVSQRIFDAAGKAIDIFFIGNDLGSQTGPLLGPELFREFVLPHIARLIDLGHQYRLKVQMHCCGGFAPLLPDLIAAGLDAVHAIQPCCQGMELKALKREFGGRIVFNGAIDSHHILIDGTPESVRAGTREVLKTMMPGGGYVAGASHDSILEETPVENIVAMFDTIREFGVYRKK